MVLDINLFRKERGGNPDLVLESQKRRHADVAAVERVISLDLSWRKAQSVLENLRKCVGICSKATGAKMKAAGGKPEPDDASLNTDDALLKSIPEEILSSAASGTLQQGAVMDLTIQQLKFLSCHISTNLIPSQECASSDLETERDTLLLSIGNIVHEEIPVEADERNNKVLRTFGDTARRTRYNHVDLMEMLGAMDCSDRVTHMAGGRSYVLKGPLVMMQLGLVQYAMNFLLQRGYEPFYPPFFMNKEAMSSVAQLSQFDEELYKVVGDGDPKYLIATSEQPACAYYRNTWLSEAELEKPIRMAGYSTCFRKEAGSHGRDTLGIFRVHQFDKVEQFVITSPRDGISWSVFAEMIQTAEEFYQSLGLPYRVVDIVTGALNNAAARKYDLEAWFSGSGAFRELVSCSNCTDYQSRSIGCRFGQNIRGAHNLKEHPHMLNATLCAITRTMCCICETYQTEEGIEVPSALRPYIPSCGELIRFKYDKPPSKQQQHSAATEKKQ